MPSEVTVRSQTKRLRHSSRLAECIATISRTSCMLLAVQAVAAASAHQKLCLAYAFGQDLVERAATSTAVRVGSGTGLSAADAHTSDRASV